MKASTAIAVFLAASFAGCEANEVILPHDRLPVTSIVVFDDPTQVQIYPDEASIPTSTLQGDLLKLQVMYAGGCIRHDFVLYGSSAFLKSNPPQAEIFLSHNARNEPCISLTRKELVFDLTPLKQAYTHVFAGSGPILLRIYPPGSTEPILPLLRYDF